MCNVFDIYIDTGEELRCNTNQSTLVLRFRKIS